MHPLAESISDSIKMMVMMSARWSLLHTCRWLPSTYDVIGCPSVCATVPGPQYIYTGSDAELLLLVFCLTGLLIMLATSGLVSTFSRLRLPYGGPVIQQILSEHWTGGSRSVTATVQFILQHLTAMYTIHQQQYRQTVVHS